LQIQQDALDQAVLAQITAVLDADVLAEAVAVAVRELRAGQAEAAPRRATITRELESIAARQHRLLDALAEAAELTYSEVMRGVLRDPVLRSVASVS